MLLIGNVDKFFSDSEFMAHCSEISKNFVARGRSAETITNHTAQGEAVERTLCEFYNMQQTPFEFLKYDAVSSSGTKVEIKHTTQNLKYWTFTKEQYNFFLSNTNDIDVIILCYLDKSTNNVYIKFKANAKSFEDYCSKSKFNDKFYYKADIASNRKQCLIY